ncbi:MAG TPA: serpin family protein [Chloroflexota bacterium]|nr:serpin family protein [Chloroflexota bacterium]
MRKLCVVLATGVVLAASGVTAHAAGSALPRPLATSANDLGFKLFSQLAAKSPRGNVLISPTSIGLAMDMVFDASRGATRRQIASVLGLQGVSTDQEREAARSLMADLAGSPDSAQLNVAASFWTDLDAPIQPAFTQAMQQYYDADAQSLDFSSPSAMQTINAWVSKATQGKIPKIVESIPPTTIAYLINAVYFKGQWASPFQKVATAPHSFSGAGGPMTVQMMHQASHLGYFANKQVQVVQLPYGSPGQGRFAMSVILPRPHVSLQHVIAGLTPGKWAKWTANREALFVALGLPRFSFKYSTDLVPYLAALGIRRAFDQYKANLTGMCTMRCSVNSVVHKTFIHVDEKGTIAAAATSVSGAIFAVSGFQVKMLVDRPFLIAISDEQTGSILFLGAVRAPSG